MSLTPSNRKLVENYIKNSISEIPKVIQNIMPQIKRVWKFDNDFDFLYGWYIGRFQEGQTLLFFQHEHRLPDNEEGMEIKEIIESHKKEIRQAIANALEHN